jgi:uridine kinase
MIAVDDIARISDFKELSLAANQIWNIATAKSVLGENTIVSICGGSCTGKSTQIATGLLNIFEGKAQVISQDHFMLASLENGVISDSYRWDHPKSFNLEASAKIMDQLRDGYSCVMPMYSFRNRTREGLLQLNPTNIVLFEGLYTGYDFLRDHADYVIYVEMPLYARLVRRLIRNLFERYKSVDPHSILESYLNAPLQAHSNFVMTQKSSSDIILKLEYDFSYAIRTFKLQPESLFAKGETIFSFASRGLQIDIRAEGVNHYFILSYNHRIYLQFPIEESTAEKLKGLDYHSV